MATAGYAKVTVVRGVVAGDKGVVRIASNRAGVVDAVYVQEGQAVTAGAPLARIATSTSTEHGALQARRAEALAAQGDALVRRRASVPATAPRSPGWKSRSPRNRRCSAPPRKTWRRSSRPYVAGSSRPATCACARSRSPCASRGFRACARR
jgi:pyruvate/2-oxoglutarate dehydrogenase complex dihydrolipoamide acyltransferase (E2) component